MGYQNFGGSGDFNFSAITFEPISGETFTLGQIKVNDAFDYGADSVSIWENGYKQYQVTYLGAEDAEAEGVEEGWYLLADFDEWAFENCKNDEVLAKGKGIVFHRGTAGAALVYSGQVQSADVTFTGFGDFNMTANTTAKTITLGDIKVNDAFDYGADSVSIWENGYKQYQVTYLGAEDAEAEGVEEGWYLTSDFDEWAFENCKNDEPLPAGKGFVFHRGTVGAGIILPSPL